MASIFLPLTGKKGGAGRICLLASWALDNPPPVILLALAIAGKGLGYRPTGTSLADSHSDSESEPAAFIGGFDAGGVGVLGGGVAVPVDKVGDNAGIGSFKWPCERMGAEGSRGRCKGGAPCLVSVLEPLALMAGSFLGVSSMFRGVHNHSRSPHFSSGTLPPAKA